MEELSLFSGNTTAENDELPAKSSLAIISGGKEQ
jgi:hypothetical protein